MNRSTIRRMNTALRVCGSALMALALAAVALAVPATAAVVHFQSETLKTYEGQLHHHEVHALTFHGGSGTGHLHVSLNDGKHMTVAYPASQQGQLVTQAREAGARVQVATVKPKATAKAHHKLRYIAGGVLIVVIVIVLVVLLVGRRRAVATQEGEGQAQGGQGQA